VPVVQPQSDFEEFVRSIFGRKACRDGTEPPRLLMSRDGALVGRKARLWR